MQTLRGYPWNHTRGFQQQKLTQTIFGRLKRRFVLIRPRDDPQSNTTVDTGRITARHLEEPETLICISQGSEPGACDMAQAGRVAQQSGWGHLHKPGSPIGVAGGASPLPSICLFRSYISFPAYCVFSMSSSLRLPRISTADCTAEAVAAEEPRLYAVPSAEP